MKIRKPTPQQIALQERIEKCHLSFERAFLRLRKACTTMAKDRKTLIRLNRQLREISFTATGQVTPGKSHSTS